MTTTTSLPFDEAARVAAIAPRSSWLWPRGETAPQRIRLFDVTFDNTHQVAAAKALAERAEAHRATRVVFVNAHVVNVMAGDPDYATVVRTAERVYADGSGMAVAARMSGTPFADNLNGTDLFPLLCREAMARGQTVFLLGAKEGVAAAAAETIGKLGYGAAIAGTRNGYFARGTAEEDDVIAGINASRASIVLVAFGVPMQDQWIAANEHRLQAPVIAGVGGLFDFFAGRVSRAPRVMRSVGMEWVWRLAMEPGRMAKRYLVGNLTFLAHATRAAIKTRASVRMAEKTAASPGSVATPPATARAGK